MDTGSGTRSLKENTVLSLNIVSELLAHREAALRSIGYRVLSLTTESYARFEIEMGQCGVLLLCYTIHEAIHRDLAELFGQRCERGVIAFVMHPKRQEEAPHAHICLLDSVPSQSSSHRRNSYQTSQKRLRICYDDSAGAL